jgi:uncharacterized surface protein with fasciclin (FAS1) repeats
MKSILLAGALALGVASTSAFANPEVGGAPMSAQKNIIQNASKSKDHTTLVAAVKAAGLVETLEGAGPFTVFAPTNEAFAALPAGTVDTLLKPENKDQLVKILTYHVVPGRLTFHKLKSLIDAGGGQATLKTVQGEDLTVMLNGTDGITVKDSQGNTANVTILNVMQSNGVIDVVDKVLMP